MQVPNVAEYLFTHGHPRDLNIVALTKDLKDLVDWIFNAAPDDAAPLKPLLRRSNSGSGRASSVAFISFQTAPSTSSIGSRRLDQAGELWLIPQHTRRKNGLLSGIKRDVAVFLPWHKVRDMRRKLLQARRFTSQ